MKVKNIFDDVALIAAWSRFRLKMRFCWSVHEVTSDHEEGRVEPYNPVQKKDKKMDKK